MRTKIYLPLFTFSVEYSSVVHLKHKIIKSFGALSVELMMHMPVEVENECTSYNFRLFAMFLPKIIRVCEDFAKL